MNSQFSTKTKFVIASLFIMFLLYVISTRFSLLFDEIYYPYSLHYSDGFEVVSMYYDETALDNQDIGYHNKSPFQIVLDESLLAVTSPPYLLLLDVTDPTRPKELSRYDLGWQTISNLRISNSQVFVANEDDGMIIMDISDPYKPQMLGLFEYEVSNNQAPAPFILGDYVYYYEQHNIGYQDPNKHSKWLVLDVSDASNIQHIGTKEGLGRPIIMYDGYLYAILDWINQDEPVSTLQIIDITEPINPIIVNTYRLPGTFLETDSFKIQARKAYISAQSGFFVLDLDDPINPDFMYTTGAIGSFRNLYIKDNIAVGDFYVVDITDMDKDVLPKPIYKLDWNSVNSQCRNQEVPTYNMNGETVNAPCPLGWENLVINDEYIYVVTHKGVLTIKFS